MKRKQESMNDDINQITDSHLDKAGRVQQTNSVKSLEHFTSNLSVCFLREDLDGIIEMLDKGRVISLKILKILVFK